MNSVPYTDAVPIRAVAPQYGGQKKKFVNGNRKLKRKMSATEDSHERLYKKSTKKQPRNGHVAFQGEEQGKLGQNVRRENPNLNYKEENFDISGVPAPICSCTGIARECYRSGTAGWQSRCCTTTVSEYPLPMSPSKPGARLSGRKMTPGAYKKVLYRLAAEGNDLSSPVDLKNHWAKHGTNKYITIK